MIWGYGSLEWSPFLVFLHRSLLDRVPFASHGPSRPILGLQDGVGSLHGFAGMSCVGLCMPSTQNTGNSCNIYQVIVCLAVRKQSHPLRIRLRQGALSTMDATQQAAMQEFQAGVTACLRSWSALRTAVDSGWGGVESAKKADDLRQNIFEHMDGTAVPPKSLSQEDLEDALAIYLEEEFSVTLEDNSERQIADTIFRMYEGCATGDFSLARQTVDAAQRAAAQVSQYPVQVQSMEHDDEDDENDTMLDSDGTAPISQSAVDYASQSLFGGPTKVKPTYEVQPVRQLGEDAMDAAAPIEVDDDGFAPVVKKKGKRGAR